MNFNAKSIINCTLAALVAVPVLCSAQENTAEPVAAQPKEYVKNTFENGVVINSQTVDNPRKRSLDFMIQHRFGLIKDDKDLFGIYAPANIRLGLTYGITKKLGVGVGVTKSKMNYDLNVKYEILRQTKKSGIPVSVVYYGNIARSAVEEENLYNSEGEFKDAYRLSYFNELMVSRKINSKISLQLGASYTYFNIIDSAYLQHDFIGISFVGKYRFSPQSSIQIDYAGILNASDLDETVKPKPTLGIGYEVSTGSHQFQVFVCNGTAILNQDNVFNTNDFFEGDVLIGFNITRQWGFKKKTKEPAE